MALWTTPRYAFRVPTTEDGMLKEVVINVTLSAPTFVEPSEALCAALDRCLELLANKKHPKILDVGTGKLRNTLYLLRNSRKVALWPVEYEELRQNFEQAETMYKEAETFRERFNPVIFPHQFIQLAPKYDLVLLTNVIGIIPIPAERLLLLQYCYDKLNKGAYLLWYSQHNEADYREGGPRCNDTTRLGDGYHIRDDKIRTFYKDIPPEEVDQILLSVGFELLETIPAGHNLSRLYKKTPHNILSSVLIKREIEEISARCSEIPDPQDTQIKKVPVSRGVRPVIPDPSALSLDQLLVRRLSKLGVGGQYATQYHRLCELILRRVFQGPLRSFSTEQGIDEGTQRVDIVAKNHASAGFFHRLDSKYHIPSPNVFFECKNYSEDPSNPELNQLAGRLKPNTGMFGVLIYRNCDDRPKLRRRCKHHARKNEYIVDLDDIDLIRLLRMRAQGPSEDIDDFMEARLDMLTLQPD